MSSKNPLVYNTEKMVKERIDFMEIKRHVVEKSITHYKERNKIDAINKTDKQQASKSKVDKSTRNESNKFMSLDKSRSFDKSRTSQRIET